MSRRLAIAVCVILVGSVPLVAASGITGGISGIELCPQSVCDQAVFAGAFIGKVNNKPTTGAFWTGITHDELPTVAGQSTEITGGSWLIRTKTRIFTGIVEPGGSLTYNGDNTFTVSLTMDVTSGGSGSMQFVGVLDHNPFPPTIVGTIQ